MRARTGAVTATYWQQILEAFYSAIEALDVTAYAWDDSDGWSQSRAENHLTEHLEAAVSIGGASRVTSDGFEHRCGVTFAARFQADDDSLSQSRLHAAIRDVVECLIRTDLPHGCRVLVVDEIGIVGPFPSGHVQATIEYTLQVPR